MSEPDWVERVYDYYGLLPYFAGRLQRGLQPSAPPRIPDDAAGRRGGVRGD